MAIKSYKPTSPGRRFQTVLTFDELTAGKPCKSLLDRHSSSGGRNSTRAGDRPLPRAAATSGATG